ncbi:MAG: serine/threonine-protein kinase [Myxococcota bacterium]
MGAGDYLPLFDLASGGVGTVSLAIRRQSGFERLYAVKRLLAHMANDEAVRDMFVTEARIAGLVRHPNVVSVLDVGEDDRGPFLVMDWIDGVPLHRFVRRAAKLGPTPISICCAIVSQAARGLHAAHELRNHRGEALRLVHRDVSPQNILLGFDGLVRVTDFGIAKALGYGSTTSTGILKGKMGYLAPEQLRFDAVDRRSDLFALGIVLYELLSGQRLYSGSGHAPEVIAKAILHQPAPSIGELRRDIPAELEELFYSMAAKAPEDRPKTAKEVADRLDEIAADARDYGESLANFLEAHFSTDRAAMRERIADALEGATQKDVAVAAAAPSAQVPRTYRIALAGAIATSVVALAVTTWAVTRDPTPATVPEDVPVSDVVELAPTSPGDSTLSARISDPPEESEPEVVEVATEEPAPTERPRVRGRRATAMRGGGRSGASMLPPFSAPRTGERPRMTDERVDVEGLRSMGWM